MKFRQKKLFITIFISVILYNCIYFKFVSAQPAGKLGYYNYNELSTRDKSTSGKFSKYLESIKSNFLKYFLNNDKSTNSANLINTSMNTPFMDFFHIPLTKKVIPKSDQVCSSIQLMSFWRLFSDVIDSVNSEFFSQINSELIKTSAFKVLNENDLSLTQSEQVDKDISRDLCKFQQFSKLTNNDTLTLDKKQINNRNLAELSLRSNKNVTNTNKKLTNFEKSKHNIKKQKTRSRNGKSTFQFGMHNYFYLNE